MNASDIDEILTRISPVAARFAGKNVVLTGGRGFLGRYFAEVFQRLNDDVLDQPMTVTLIDNLITAGDAGPLESANPKIRFIEHNVIEPVEIDHPVDFVIHAVGIASPFYYRAYPLETLEVAITGTRNMLELAERNDARMTFFSSSEIYGDPDPKHVPMAESYRGNVACQGPRACYDESKRVGETLCDIFHSRNGTATNTIRPFNVYGPGMQENDYRVLPNFASRIKAGRNLSIYGSGVQTRTFCYITDAIVGFLLVILNGVPGEAYNIGNRSPEVSMLDLVARIGAVLGREIGNDLIEYPDSYPGDEPMRRSPDIRKATLQLGFQPIVGLEDGLGRFFNWTDQHYSGQI